MLFAIHHTKNNQFLPTTIFNERKIFSNRRGAVLETLKGNAFRGCIGGVYQEKRFQVSFVERKFFESFPRKNFCFQLFYVHLCRHQLSVLLLPKKKNMSQWATCSHSQLLCTYLWMCFTFMGFPTTWTNDFFFFFFFAFQWIYYKIFVFYFFFFLKNAKDIFVKASSLCSCSFCKVKNSPHYL